MRRERSSGSFRRDGREKATSIPRALSWLGLSTLSRQTRRIFRSQGELVAEQQGQDDDDWVYMPQHRKGHDSLPRLDGAPCWSSMAATQCRLRSLPFCRGTCTRAGPRTLLPSAFTLRHALAEAERLGFQTRQRNHNCRNWGLAKYTAAGLGALLQERARQNTRCSRQMQAPAARRSKCGTSGAAGTRFREDSTPRAVSIAFSLEVNYVLSERTLPPLLPPVDSQPLPFACSRDD
ncbi:hypothetical protein SKAU_G00195410 [Synaphobranchus kaupii]|uniref:Uncharacterized protein n=1 Tax=Synaphobranchus kaupii TaxID=118154 RepID=A0A9Q1FEL3_SYNKA|nr:hypothetical protein SKAU_G00195410 [Synaphobranchus kaupii]